MGLDKKILNDLEHLTEIGYSLSMGFAGVSTKDRRKGISTHILARLIPNCISLLKLIPGSKFNKTDINDDFYDFASVSSLTRNLLEIVNINFYFCIEQLSDEELEFRLRLYDSHETLELLSIMNSLGAIPAEKPKVESDFAEFLKLLTTDSFFLGLNKNLQKQILSGKRGTHLTQFEIADRRNIDLNHFRGIYKLLSTQTHSASLAIKLTYVSSIKGNKGEFTIALIDTALDYLNHHLADMIFDITTLWDLQFSNTKSKSLVNYYIGELRKIDEPDDGDNAPQ